MKILMVCLGNICRSPLAEGILQSKVNSQKIKVDSAGTAAYHVGELPDIRSIAVAEKHGIDLKRQRARKFTTADFNTFDLIFAMDKSNYQNILSLASSKDEMQKVYLILMNKEEVPDPYYGGDQGFENVYQLLDKACVRIANKIRIS